MKFDFKEPLFINEGFSDTTVMIDMGFQAIGKYNDLHKLDNRLIGLIKCFKHVIIVSDANDSGIRGAEELHKRLPNAEVILPEKSYKDIREQYLGEGKYKVQAKIKYTLGKLRKWD